MEIIKTENLNFTYPNAENHALKNINLEIKKGEFVLLFGKSGCGKTTLLRLLKPSVSPVGELSGKIYFEKKPIGDIALRNDTEKIGFVLQNPESQIVTDTVWHELAFGLENLGFPNSEIRARVSEMASFFGIEDLFHKKTFELSGGQKQLLNLASVMVLNPSALILDEPTSQLDPISARRFLDTLKKVNEELGITIILSEHRLEEVFPLCHRAVVLDNGEITADGSPREVCTVLKDLNHEMYNALPVAVRVWGSVDNEYPCPLTVREGRNWLKKFTQNMSFLPHFARTEEKQEDESILEVKNAYFRYGKDSDDVIKGLSLEIKRGEIFALLGGNGVGKTTLLSLISGINRLNSGKILIKGQKISDVHNLYDAVLGVLPQNPETLFVKNTVFEDLCNIFKNPISPENEKTILQIARLCRIENLLTQHPYDLSGGEKQRTALAKILLKTPEILLLDEPTKGMDASFKEIFSDILKALKSKGITVLMVSHDIEFCAKNADRCGLVFDGSVTADGTPCEFFSKMNFYTTSASRMSREFLPDAILAEDIISACGGKIAENKNKDNKVQIQIPERKTTKKSKKTICLSAPRLILGIVFGILTVLTCIFCLDLYTDFRKRLFELLTFLELFVCISCFTPKKELTKSIPVKKAKLTKRTYLSAIFVLIAIPLTIYFGKTQLQDRKYYFISILIIIETMIPFLVSFESRKPKAKEIIAISILCAMSVAGRAAFASVPHFKPVLALVIISGVCFGAESGFLVGAVSGFVSNFFFGQGPWTPWQMFAYGLVGFVAGIIFRRLFKKGTKISLCVFGFLSAFLIFGVILNSASLILWQPNPTTDMLIAALVAGIPFDFIHAVSTVFFLWFLAEPMIEKIERIKSKYGI